MISPSLVDIEFAWQGWIPHPNDHTYGAPFPEALIIPRSQWKQRLDELRDADMDWGPHPPGCVNAVYSNEASVFNQSPESSCVYNSAVGAWMRVYNRQLGNQHQLVLSPMSGYCRVARSRHSGSYMWGALELLNTEGVLPSSEHHAGEWPHTFHENTPFVRASSLPDGWQETAHKFRVLEWCRIDTKEQFGSALLNQMPICYGRSGHSILGEDLVYENNRFYCRSCDSYGYNNRDGTGRIYDTERNWSTGGAWACRGVTMPGQ